MQLFFEAWIAAGITGCIVLAWASLTKILERWGVPFETGMLVAFGVLGTLVAVGMHIAKRIAM